MEPIEGKLESLGKVLREALAAERSEGDDLLQARASFLRDFSRHHAPSSTLDVPARRRARWLSLALAASLGAALTGMWLWPRSVSFQVGESRPGRLGAVIESVTGHATSLRFSEGSRLLLHEGARMRVLSVGSDGARVLVENGILDVSVAALKTRKTRWEFEAGPYLVTVTGTKFRMAFYSQSRTLSLSTQEGQVVVSGACQKTPKKISAGESVVLSCSTEEDLLPPSEVTQDKNVPIPAPAEAQAEPPSSQPAVFPANAPARGEPAWRGLLAAGRLSDGLHSARLYGFQRACQLATAKELLALSDAARLFGDHSDHKEAVTPLHILRRRFASTTDASAAAFRLGLVAFERKHAYAEAARWFEIYMREQPSGPLMGDAFGRLMQARALSGDVDRAREHAQQYLHRFPEGPYALEARGILSR